MLWLSNLLGFFSFCSLSSGIFRDWGAYHLRDLAGSIGQSTNGNRPFCRTERAIYEQTGHSFRGGSFCPETVLGSVELAHPAGQF